MSWNTAREPPSWAGRSLEDRALAIEAACRAATQILASTPDREARLARTDPVPASTEALLRRLAAARNG